MRRSTEPPSAPEARATNQVTSCVGADSFNAVKADCFVGGPSDLAGDRIVEVAAGDVGGQVLAAGLVDEVRMDVVPVVFGSGKRYFGSVHAQHLFEDPDVVIQGNRVLHLRHLVRGSDEPLRLTRSTG